MKLPEHAKGCSQVEGTSEECDCGLVEFKSTNFSTKALDLVIADMDKSLTPTAPWIGTAKVQAWLDILRKVKEDSRC